jgi:SAM-dependent methyltransferase
MIAVLHHIPSNAMRSRAISEAARVLVPGGTLIVTVWDLWRARHFRALTKGAIAVLAGKSDLDIGDLWLTFGTNMHPRFVHALTFGEIASLYEHAGLSVAAQDRIARPSGERNIVTVGHKTISTLGVDNNIRES